MITDFGLTILRKEAARTGQARVTYVQRYFLTSLLPLFIIVAQYDTYRAYIVSRDSDGFNEAVVEEAPGEQYSCTL
jgi:hypothetical protein